MLQTYTLKTQLFADLSSLKELNFIKFNKKTMTCSNFFTLPEKDKKQIIKKAIRAANEEQKDLMDRYKICGGHYTDSKAQGTGCKILNCDEFQPYIKKDDNGEWVKWEDVQNFLSECGILIGEDAGNLIKSVMKKPSRGSIEQNKICSELLKIIRG